MKKYNIIHNCGHTRYVLSYHNGAKFHKDGSPFFDIETFKNKTDLKKAENKLISEGYVYNLYNIPS